MPYLVPAGGRRARRSSVAFPAISTGIYGYPVAEASPVAIGAVRDADTAVELVRFVLFRPAHLEVFRGALEG